MGVKTEIRDKHAVVVGYSEFSLQPGDVFATKNPQGLGKLICVGQSIKSQDGSAEYGHSGIITDEHGKTFEAVWTIAEQNLFEAYKGQKAVIARWQGMTPEVFKNGFAAVYPLLGRTYPYHRLILHLLGLGRWVHIVHTPVCSELTAQFLISAGAITLGGENFWGITPDNLVDEWRISRHFDILFEGII